MMREGLLSQEMHVYNSCSRHAENGCPTQNIKPSEVGRMELNNIETEFQDQLYSTTHPHPR